MANSPQSTLEGSTHLHLFSETELHQLYSAATVKNLPPDAFLVKKGGCPASIYLINKGSLKVVRNGGHSKTDVAIFSAGDCIGNTPSCTTIDPLTSCVALEPLTVMELDQTGLQSLSANVRSYILSKLVDCAAEFMKAFRAGEKLQAGQSLLLTNYMRNFYQQYTGNYAESPLIQKIVNNIPSLPTHVGLLMARLQDQDVSVKEIVDLAQEDPSLVSAVLKTVNSPLYGFASQIADFHRAVLLLGLNQIYQLVLSHGIRNVMPPTDDFREMHAHSVLISHIAYELSRACNKEKPVVMSTIGLLHDIGKSVISLLRKQNPSLVMFIDLLDHAKLGSILLGKWNLPDSICLPVENQAYCYFCRPGRLSPEYRNSLAILHVAHLCYDTVKEAKPDATNGVFVDDYLSFLGFKKFTVKRLTMKHTLPSLVKNANKFPVHVRTFFSQMLKNFYREQEGS